MARCPSRIALLIEASQPAALPAAHVAGLTESGRRFLTLLERRGRLTLSEAIERMDIRS